MVSVLVTELEIIESTLLDFRLESLLPFNLLRLVLYFLDNQLFFSSYLNSANARFTFSDISLSPF